MKKQGLCVSAVLVTSLIAGGLAASRCSSKDSGSERNEDPLSSYICAGTIDVAVRITNEDGEPLNGVLVGVSHVKLGLGGFTTERKNEHAVADGNFHIRKTDICGLRLYFTKPGYFGEAVEYSVGKDISHIEDILDLDRVVVLKLRPTPAPMERIEGILKTSATGPAAVVKLQPGTRYASPINSEKRGELDSLGDYCFLNPRIEDGRIDSVSRRSQTGGTYDAPKAASLRSSRPDDGFILFEPLNEYPIAERAFREMREAPKAGYLPELEIPEDSGSRVYFYCFLGGKYGKGFIVRPSLREENGESTAVSVVKILVNPTGHTNVATLD